MHKMAKKEKNQKLHRAISFFPKIGLKIIVFVQWDDELSHRFDLAQCVEQFFSGSCQFIFQGKTTSS